MINLPEGVAAIIVFKGLFGLQRTTIMAKSEIIIKAATSLGAINRDFRIFPINSDTPYARMPDPKIAWAEGMTLDEFLDYLND